MLKWRLPRSRVHRYIYNTFSREVQSENKKPKAADKGKRETLQIPALRGKSAPKDAPMTQPNASDGNEAKW